MKRYRIGNDIDLEWTILKEDGTAYDLTGKNISLCMTCGGSHYEVSDFSVAANVISWTFFGKDQARCGAYDVILRENCGEVDMITVDTESALMLVSRTSQVGGYDNTRIHTSSATTISTTFSPEEQEELRNKFLKRLQTLATLLEAEEIATDLDVVVLSEDELAELQEQGALDPEKIYYAYEVESEPESESESVS